ncbi:hypothetical protein HK097_000972 [Rhizophlyctis rosea]|uniref:Phosphatidylserine decarboxylase proenzyme 2 n=1 Tax=Rhizophlyctis rosea TaxID=64517 RepID=A0AAD5SHK7_9FUNG|nr:hypothetical protein HK097_000972 [Rhizophlyctis rosea]
MKSATLRVQVVEAKGLTAKDRSGTSDPFVIVKLGDQTARTSVCPKTLNPVWNATFDFTVTPVLFDAPIVFTVWDKDRIGKDFLGQIVIPLAECAHLAGTTLFDDPNNKEIWNPLNTRTARDIITGDICIKLGFVGELDPDIQHMLENLDDNETVPAQLVTTDDPADDLYFNNLTRYESLESTASAGSDSDTLPDEPTTMDGQTLDHHELKGLLTVDVVGARNLPIRKNFTRTTFDCDPFAVVTYGKKTFRTKSIRHTLNPYWNERAFLHIKHKEYEGNWKLSLAVYDYDKLSTHDLIGSIALESQALVAECRKQGREVDSVLKQEPIERTYALNLKKEAPEAATVTLRFNFIPYNELRRNFWMTLIKNFDSDGNGSINKIELTTMLDTLGSTFSDETIDMMFASKEKSPEDELTFDELCEVLEAQLTGEVVCQRHEKKKKEKNEPGMTLSTEVDEKEHLIRIRECPICHKVIKRKGDLDVVSHVALCANQDLGKVDNFLLGGFLTEAQASRRWYTKIVTYVTYGGYSVGKNNANILVQDRATGQLVEERMPIYIRLGIRLLYQVAGARNAVETRYIKNLLKNLSVKQGRKFDAPVSVKAIKHFVAFHNISLDEVAEPLESFKSFNEFFYRKIKPEARKLASPDPRVLVSPADSRTTAFASVDAAKKIWVKGRGFTIEKLLQDPEQAKRYDGGTMAIFRLAPQDYHRFHFAVDGVVGPTNWIDGTYFTVNPMAIRTSVDVYTENIRCVTYIQTPHFGTVAYVCIGAMMVGSTILTSKEGQEVKRMDEHGYFAFGGSTILLIFEKGMVQFDRDILDNTEQCLETLVKMGNSVGLSIKA